VPGSPDPVIPEISVNDTWAALQRNSAAQLVDVRTRAEWVYVGAPDVSKLGRQVLFAEWQSFPDNQVDPQTTKIGMGPMLALTDQETFTGEHADAANKMLTRDYRPPFVVPKTEDL